MNAYEGAGFNDYEDKIVIHVSNCYTIYSEYNFSSEEEYKKK